MQKNSKTKDPMRRPFENVPQCGAKTRSGEPCKQSAMQNGRCRMHGGASTGPKTPEGKTRSRMGPYKHGFYTKEAKAERRAMAQWMKQAQRQLQISIS
jgi:hypothetical protein